MRRAARLWPLLLLVSTGCARTPAGIGVVERFDVETALQPDGSFQISEQIVVVTDPGSPAVFSRWISGGRTDEFAGVSASIVGSGNSEHVSVESDPDLAVAWRLPATPRNSHTLELRYRATGVVEIQGMRGTVSWPVLPERRQYGIQSARISVTLPPGTRLLKSAGIDLGGWQWTETAGGLAATRTNIAPHEPGRLHLELALDAVPMIEPHWQTRAAFGQQLTPSFIAAGLFILVTGGGILWAIQLRYFQSSVTPEDARHTQRREVARGLRSAGLVVVAFGLLASAGGYAFLQSIGPWPQAVPVSLVLVGVWFVLASHWFARRA